MDGLPKDILDNIRQTLEKDKVHVTARIAQLHVQDPYSNPDRTSDNAAVDADANEESSHERFTALVETLEGQLEAIDAALLRLQQGTYGFCTNCGNPIEPDRLAALPTATLCLTCEKLKET